jgi:hypothetical protein
MSVCSHTAYILSVSLWSHTWVYSISLSSRTWWVFSVSISSHASKHLSYRYLVCFVAICHVGMQSRYTKSQVMLRDTLTVMVIGWAGSRIGGWPLYRTNGLNTLHKHDTPNTLCCYVTVTVICRNNNSTVSMILIWLGCSWLVYSVRAVVALPLTVIDVSLPTILWDLVHFIMWTVIPALHSVTLHTGVFVVSRLHHYSTCSFFCC